MRDRSRWSATSRTIPTSGRRCRRMCFRSATHRRRNGSSTPETFAEKRHRLHHRQERCGDRPRGQDRRASPTACRCPMTSCCWRPARCRAACRLPSRRASASPISRTFGDALAIRAHLKPGRRVAIVGGGFIGLELAASARKRGARGHHHRGAAAHPDARRARGDRRDRRGAAPGRRRRAHLRRPALTAIDRSARRRPRSRSPTAARSTPIWR